MTKEEAVEQVFNQPTPSDLRHHAFITYSRCNICGRRKGGTKPINHDKCARIRRASLDPAGSSVDHASLNPLQQDNQ